MPNKLIKSFVYAFRGLKYAWQEEQSFRIQIIAAMVLIGAILFSHFSLLESSLLLFAATVVLMVEVLNTVIEKTFDELEPGQKTSIGKIKDLMAGAVLISSLGAAAVGILVFFNHFLGA